MHQRYSGGIAQPVKEQNSIAYHAVVFLRKTININISTTAAVQIRDKSAIWQTQGC